MNIFFKISLSFVFIICMIFNCSSQTSEIIQSSRPGNASNVNTVGKNIIQLENGLNYNDNYKGNNVIFLNSFLRFGWKENLEINLLNDLNYSNSNLNNRNVYLGIKYIFRNKERLSISTILNQNVGELWNNTNSQTNINVIFNHQSSFKWNFCLNIISSFYLQSKEIYEGNWVILNASYPLKKQHNLYFENSFFIAENLQYYFRTGWFIQFGDNFQIDASLRLDNQNIAQNTMFFYGFTAGCSVRF